MFVTVTLLQNSTTGNANVGKRTLAIMNEWECVSRYAKASEHAVILIRLRSFVQPALRAQ